MKGKKGAVTALIAAFAVGCGSASDKRFDDAPEPTATAVAEADRLNAARLTWQDETFEEHGHVCEFREHYPSHGFWRARMNSAVFVRVCDTELDGFECAVRRCAELE